MIRYQSSIEIVTSSGGLALRGILRLLEPLMAGEVRRGEAKELVVLKGLLEGGAANADR